MTIRVVKDATLTVKAGQLVEVEDAQAVLAIRLGLAEEERSGECSKKSNSRSVSQRKRSTAK